MLQLTEIGSFEAKTRLAELLRETESGATFVITRRGRPVARLVPFEAEAPAETDWREGFRKLQRDIDLTSTAAERKSWIEEGRR